MDFKRILRTPMVWVILIIGIGVLWFSVGETSGFTRIDTSAAEKLITDNKVDSAKFVDNEHIDLTLKKGQSYTGGDVKDATRVRAYYVTPRGPEL
ncbi:MAG: ATP-dependent metallopeptidase FtsH/Yme1/Tma family protein, partial [Oryzihumus sp.]